MLLKRISLIFLVLISLVLIDQAALFIFGIKKNHVAICSLRRCYPSPFREVPNIGFLLNKEYSHKLNNLIRNKDFPLPEIYQLSDEGFRLSLKQKPPSKRTINLYGDSFTFGLFLKEGETLTDVLNGLSPYCQFNNYGVPAFDLWQMIRLAQSPLVHKASHNIFLFISDDIVRMTRPFEVHRIGRQTTLWDVLDTFNLSLSFPYPRIPLFLIQNSFLFQKLYLILNEIFWEKVSQEELLKSLENLARKNNEGVKFYHLPSSYDFGLNDHGLYDFIAPSILKEYSLIKPDKIKETLGMETFLSFFIEEDGHPNAKGAQWYAELLKERLPKDCFPSQKESL